MPAGRNSPPPIGRNFGSFPNPRGAARGLNLLSLSARVPFAGAAPWISAFRAVMKLCLHFKFWDPMSIGAVCWVGIFARSVRVVRAVVYRVPSRWASLRRKISRSGLFGFLPRGLHRRPAEHSADAFGAIPRHILGALFSLASGGSHG